MFTETHRNLMTTRLNQFRWRAVCLATLSLAVLLISEAIVAYRLPTDQGFHPLTIHLPLVVVVAVGIYLFSRLTFALIHQYHAEILQYNEESIAFENRFRALIENSTDLIILLRADGEVRYVSPSVTRMLGYTTQEIIGRNLLDVIVPHDHVKTKNLLYESCKKPEGIVSDLFRIYHKNGSWHWISIQQRNLLADPNVEALVWNARDITDWKLANDSLRSLTDGIPVGIYRTTSDGEFLSANPALTQMLGYQRGEDLLATKAVDHYADPGDRLRWQDLMIRNGQVSNFEFRARRRDGTIIWLKDSARSVRDEHTGSLYYDGAVEEITERKQAEQALVAKQAQLAGILQSAMDAIITVDASQRIMLFNSAAAQMFRCPATEAMGQPIGRFIADWNRLYGDSGLRTLDRQGATNKTGWTLDDLTGLRGGDKFPIEAVIWRSKFGKETIYTLSVRDVTERKQAVDSLRKLSRAIEQAAESIFITDQHGIIEYVNPAFETMTGFARSDAIGQAATILRAEIHDSTFNKELKKKTAAGDAPKAIFTNRKKDGQIYLTEEIVSPIVDGRGTITHFVSTGRDVTDRVHAEKELRDSREQLRALATHLDSVREEEQTRIAREMHDELGQTLTVLKYDLAWLASRLPGDSTSLRQKCNEMESLTDGTIASMRRIASELHPRLLDDLGLDPAVEWLTKNFESHTGLRCELDSSLGDVILNSELATAVFRILREALTNVARHAQATRVTVKLQWDQDEVVLVVRDDGRGISNSEVTGMNSLGLLGMRERALAWGGTVVVTGEAGQGTTVIARFPQKHLEEAAPEQHPAEDAA